MMSAADRADANRIIRHDYVGDPVWAMPARAIASVALIKPAEFIR